MGARVPDISYVLPVFNKAAALPFFIQSLCDQTGEFSAEYIFVDDVSSDDSLAVLRARTADMANVQIIENTRNAGPAIRLNQGAALASGKYLALFDCDEVLAPNAIATLLSLATRHDGDMVHGKWHKTNDPIEQIQAVVIAPDVTSTVFENPLERVLGRGIVRMTWLVERALFLQAGGCDEQVFVQDESLPLRLAAHARCLVDSAAIVTWVPDAGSHLSDNKIQQHHDRFMTFYHFLRQNPDLPTKNRAQLAMKCVSAARKALRDGCAMPGFKVQFAYLAAKLGLLSADSPLIDTFHDAFAQVPAIRRPDNP
ncbi:glycosyl transferase family 2 [Thalassospira mesophila]|uniref:Glycosyl transferase family 2 n=2 Tax=Thalassospira mesophila TaxID=1293891 RepID=A0A1Y2L3N7_9PROT|nr:glycosyl transferase family 2 [Thalassospira mesophila]